MKLEEEKDEKEKPATERRREYTDIGLDLGEREEHVACHSSALAMTDEACREAEMYRFFHFSGLPHLKLAFNAAKEMANLVAFRDREVKRAAAEEKHETSTVFYCRRTVRVKVKSKVIPTSSLKIE